MTEIFLVQENGATRSLERVRCRDEARELQTLLEQNLHLLPGEQISPGDPRRWLLVKREMPVPDPAGGGDRWSVDLFLVDQAGIPTFVECKRFLDTRSRREVVGQMLEYAANGPHYWSQETLREYAMQTAADRGVDLDEAVRQLQPTSGETVEDLLDAVENNLREGQVRLVFFLEEAPIELKSIVDFLNRQMERSEILIVEARQYEIDGKRLVSPMLFGYTEEARRVKRTVTVTSGGRRRWTEVDFFQEATRCCSETDVAALQRLLRFARSHGLDIKWGTGAQSGSYNIVVPGVSNKSIISVVTTGKISFNFGWLNDTAQVVAFRDKFLSLVAERLGLELVADAVDRYPSFKAEDWTSKLEALEGLLIQLLESTDTSSSPA